MISTARLPVAVARERAAHAARLLAADPGVRLVYLFGSAADPDRPADLGVRDIGVRDIEVLRSRGAPAGSAEVSPGREGGAALPAAG